MSLRSVALVKGSEDCPHLISRGLSEAIRLQDGAGAVDLGCTGGAEDVQGVVAVDTSPWQDGGGRLQLT